MNTIRKSHIEIGTLMNYLIGAAIILSPVILAKYCSAIINLANF